MRGSADGSKIGIEPEQGGHETGLVEVAKQYSEDERLDNVESDL